ncbi:hypothetical protein [Pseudalkalibacillus decolorationis]|uniref:hypothetical protein n=1 Tax=Pseudalkalibacillus decolorationis TaxID=163879 RepID=UPI002147CDC8|nr:hypothetical protein [Pseudalkalibacillus decolorationis]
MKKKKQGVRFIAIILVVIGFFYIAERFQENGKSAVSVNEEVFEVAKSKDELHKILLGYMDDYQAHILKSVYHYNLMDSFEEEKITVMELNRDVQFHEMWNDNFSFYLLYSMNLLPGDEKPDEIPSLNFEGLTLHNDKEKAIRLDVQHLLHGQNGFTELSEGVVLDGRLYRALWFSPQLNEMVMEKFLGWIEDKEKGMFNFDEAFAQVDSVAINDAKLVDGSERGIVIEDIPLNVDFSSQTKPLASVPINKTIQLENNTAIEIKKLIFGLNYQRLYFEANPSQNNLNKFQVMLNKTFHELIIAEDEEGRTFVHLPFDPSQQLSQYNIEFKKAVFHSEKELTTVIKQPELEAFKKKMTEKQDLTLPFDRKIGSVGGTDYTLYQLAMSPQGLGQNYVGIEIKVEQESDHSYGVNFQDYTRYQEQLKQHPSFEQTYPFSFFELTDQEGEPIPTEEQFGRNGVDVLGLNKDQFMNLNEINIRLFQLPESLHIEENEVKIKVPDKFQPDN